LYDLSDAQYNMFANEAEILESLDDPYGFCPAVGMSLEQSLAEGNIKVYTQAFYGTDAGGRNGLVGGFYDPSTIIGLYSRDTASMLQSVRHEAVHYSATFFLWTVGDDQDAIDRQFGVNYVPTPGTSQYRDYLATLMNGPQYLNAEHAAQYCYQLERQ